MNNLKAIIHSRKFIFAAFSIFLLIICWFITAFWPLLSSNFFVLKDGVVLITITLIGAHTTTDIIKSDKDQLKGKI